MDSLENFFAEHLDDRTATCAVNNRVLRLQATVARYHLFKVGKLRFAVPSPDITAITRGPDPRCDYLPASAAVPLRFCTVAKPDDDHQSYLHFTGTRYGIGPCKDDGDIVLPLDAAQEHIANRDEPWIVATLSEPPALVVDRVKLCNRLHQVAQR